MNYSLEIRPDALADIEEAATWYEEREADLGPDFVAGLHPLLRASVHTVRLSGEPPICTDFGRIVKRTAKPGIISQASPLHPYN